LSLSLATVLTDTMVAEIKLNDDVKEDSSSSPRTTASLPSLVSPSLPKKSTVAAIVTPANSPPSSPTSVKLTVPRSSKKEDKPEKITTAESSSSKGGSGSSKIHSDKSVMAYYDVHLDVKKELAPDFEPTPNSVICGRGKECFDSEGVSKTFDLFVLSRILVLFIFYLTILLILFYSQNKRFREIINSYLDEYTAASGKSEKSRIVTRAMNIIREKSPGGSFVKKEKGIWYEVSLRYAREKVGAWFRDCLSHRYKSSSKAKHAKKMAQRVDFGDVLLVDPNTMVVFPPDFASQIKAHERRTSTCSSPNSPSAVTFYDIDDLSPIPFDNIVDFEF